MNMPASPLLDWSGQTCVIAASGPSLTDDQVDQVKSSGIKSIAVNSTAFKMPWANVFYGCDFQMWRHYMPQFPKDSRTRCWTQDRTSAERHGINYVRQEAMAGLGKHGLRVNGNSGAGAINLAFLFGVKRIILIGFDMQLGAHGKRHWHPDHVHPMTQNQPFGDWIFKMTQLAKELKAEGVSVVNCTPGSALTCFKTAELSEALQA